MGVVTRTVNVSLSEFKTADIITELNKRDSHRSLRERRMAMMKALMINDEAKAIELLREYLFDGANKKAFF